MLKPLKQRNWRTKQANFNLLRMETYCFVHQTELHSHVLQGVYNEIKNITLNRTDIEMFTDYDDINKLTTELTIPSKCSAGRLRLKSLGDYRK